MLKTTALPRLQICPLKYSKNWGKNKLVWRRAGSVRLRNVKCAKHPSKKRPRVNTSRHTKCIITKNKTHKTSMHETLSKLSKTDRLIRKGRAGSSRTVTSEEKSTVDFYCSIHGKFLAKVCSDNLFIIKNNKVHKTENSSNKITLHMYFSIMLNATPYILLHNVKCYTLHTPP